MARIARFAPEAEVEKIASEAIKAALAGKNAYHQVAASAWAVRALADRGRTRKAEEIASKLLDLAHAIDHPVSSMDALFLLWQAVWPLDGAVRQQVQHQLLGACQVAASWKVARTLSLVALMLAAEDAGQARHILEQMREGRYKRQTQRALDAGETLEPFPFFG